MVSVAGRGGGDRNPRRLRLEGQTPPMKPIDLSAAVGAKWDELIALMPNMLAEVDGYELRILATLLVQSDELAKQLAAGIDPVATRLFLNVSKQVHSLSASFGLNPFDRARLGLVDIQETEPDPFLEYLNEVKQSRNN